MPLPIAQLGQPVLRRRADPVPLETLAAPEFRQLIAQMLDTLQTTGGVGLAAPQVFESKRVFLAVVEQPGEDEDLVIDIFINPHLVSLSEEQESDWEGCLSFAELSVLVPRPKQVRVEYLNLKGQLVTRDLVGFPARVVQHEYDHLDGILTIDRAATTRDIVKVSELDVVRQDRAGSENVS
jgi:peptide deformylase